jgi:hypothetical protein
VAACAVLAAFLVAFWPSATNAPKPQAFSAVRPSPITATAALFARSWGTEIDIRCSYPAGTSSWGPYQLVMTDRANQRHSMGSWSIAGGSGVRFTAATDLRPNQIASLQIVADDGTPVLQLTE